MARATITSTVIVPEVLSTNNYKEWSNCMRNYLLAQNLWNVVESGNVQPPTEEEPTANWKRENAAVLHALQISCAPEIFARIMGKTSANEAWQELAKIHETKNQWHLDGPQSSSQRSELHRFFEGTIPGQLEPIERSRSCEFLAAIWDKKWDEVLKLLRGCQLPGNNPKFFGATSLLHLAVQIGDMEGVEKLLPMMSEEEILSQEEYGCTALAYAAYLGATDIAKCLTIKNKKLLTIPDTKGMIPVVRACFQRFKGTTDYLYTQTRKFLIVPENGEHGSLLLHFCILNEMLDIALDLLHKYPRLVFTKFKYNNRVSTPILTLSAQTSLFPSGIRFSFLHRWIYYGISVASEAKELKRPPATSADSRIPVPSSHQNEQNDIKKQVPPCLQRGLTLFFLGKHGFSSALQKFLGIKYLYERKLIHEFTFRILSFTASQLSTLNAEEVIESGVVPALFQSIQHGIIEFLEIENNNRDIMMCPIDGKTKFVFTYAIECRQEKYFLKFSLREAHFMATWTDDDGNNALHTAAKLGPESYLSNFSGAALQLQKELQWFKEFESAVPECKGWVNHNGETPRQVFTRDHMKLLKEAEAWMKQTAQSYIIVGTLIITTMFAAAFSSIPGGNNGRRAYIMSDAISLFTASTSVLTFLGILTSRYTEDDFHKSLPIMLIFGILTLFISVVTMSVAFCAAVSIMLQERWWVVFLLVLLACIPVVVFLRSQSRLLIEIWRSTCRSAIFRRKESSVRENILSIMKKYIGKLMKRRE